ncbi:hypothetical protein [Deinococcus yavapaiensis]|uniref:Uncharacterized protein n=1 Tax=Deinococcus yavapaiensis KR-236 TaxID=694435 RepID=A0A318SA72_9DEIO|nr:hypothetical protein [Deinococcus yavapaiensis]PYE54070.1 hypothetical protein DES52_10632 [Deinococcus yavapaiensis KR-236]
MVASFPREAPILRYRLYDHRIPVARRRDLLWPVWAYRVVAPRPRSRRWNFLQRAVTGLLLRGYHDDVAIADLLHLHPDLVRVVRRQLVDNGTTFEDGLVKPDAARRLRDETFDLAQNLDDFITGYVFQDPFSGLLLPRLASTIETPDVTFDDRGFPVLLFNNRSHRPFVELPTGAPPATPTPRDVLDAVTRFERARHGSSEAFEDDDRPANVARRVDRVNFIEDRPHLMFVSTYLYFEEGDQDWNVCDPFGLRTSPLTTVVKRRSRDSKNLAAFVERLHERVTPEGEASYASVLDRVQADAEREVERHFGQRAQEHPLYQWLLECELAHQELRSASDKHAERKANEALKATRKLIEGVLAVVRDAHATAGVEQHLIEHDRTYNARRLDAMAQSLGFVTPLPERLSSVKVSDVYAMANRAWTGKLRPLLVATLIAAYRDARHPLRAVATRDPTFLHDLESAIHWGGGAAHVPNADDAPLPPAVTVAPNARDVAYRALSALCFTDPSALRSFGATASPAVGVVDEPLDDGIDDLDA